MTEKPEEPASPPCYAAGADSAYMGYAGQEAIAGELWMYAAALRKAQAVAPREWLEKLEKQQAAVAVLARSCDHGEEESAAGCTAAEIWGEAIGRLQAFLPRIGDDGLHRRLRALLREGREVLAGPGTRV